MNRKGLVLGMQLHFIWLFLNVISDRLQSTRTELDKIHMSIESQYSNI